MLENQTTPLKTASVSPISLAANPWKMNEYLYLSPVDCSQWRVCWMIMIFIIVFRLKWVFRGWADIRAKKCKMSWKATSGLSFKELIEDSSRSWTSVSECRSSTKEWGFQPLKRHQKRGCTIVFWLSLSPKVVQTCTTQGFQGYTQCGNSWNFCREGVSSRSCTFLPLYRLNPVSLPVFRSE